VNFSFILSGHGEYTCPDGTWPVAAPCVLTQWSDVPFYYGPDSTWEEFFVCFPRKYYSQFLKNGMMSTARRLWPITDVGHFMSSLRNFWSLLEENTSVGWIDRVDMSIQHVILESLLGSQNNDETDKAINSIRLHVEKNYLEHHDFESLAIDAGMSPSTFRRYWEKAVGMPPAKYVMHLKIGRAQRYLIETRLSIMQIADKLGFDDHLYFTRKFTQHVGMCPTEYRRRNQMPHGL
jgi:AraC-like DNA-binding protein